MRFARSLGALSLVILLSGPALLGISPEDGTEVSWDLDEIQVCPQESAGCARSTCVDLCRDQGEDPVECDTLCNLPS